MRMFWGAAVISRGEIWGNCVQPLLHPAVFQNFRENGEFDPEGVILWLEFSPEMGKGAFYLQLCATLK